MNAIPQRPMGQAGTATASALPMGGRPGATQDFWDVGTADLTGQAPVQEFSEIVEVDTRGRNNRTALYVLIFLVAAALGWFAFETFVNQEDPVAKLSAFINGLMGETAPVDEAPETPVTNAIITKATRAIKAAVEPPLSGGQQTLAGNPYWVLPNAILGSKAPMSRPWAPEEEETFRAGLAHHYTYQRFKTVMDIRERRLFGSDAILWDALQDKKFWTRMYAAVGLAEFNVEVSLSTFEGALTGARSELIADFFERFTRKPNAAQLFVLRQVVRLLDEKGRLIVLQGINRSNDKLRDLYMTAATQDPGTRVQKWVAKALRARPIASARQADLLAVVEGRVDGEYLIRGAKAPKVSAATPPIPAPSVASEEDLERELEQFENSGGDVEFYEDAPQQPAVNDDTDTDTFEYDEYDE